MRNKYTIDGVVTTIHVIRKDCTKLNILIDTEDIPRLKDCTIGVQKCSNGVGFYAVVNFEGEKKLLHRYLKDAIDGMEVDHIHSITLDDRKAELRHVTHAENAQNRKGPQKHSQSGVLGVTWCKKDSKWWAQVGKKFLGLFDHMGEAIKVVNDYRAEHMPFSKEAACKNNSEEK